MCGPAACVELSRGGVGKLVAAMPDREAALLLDVRRAGAVLPNVGGTRKSRPSTSPTTPTIKSTNTRKMCFV
jgi:hypothetical protein